MYVYKPSFCDQIDLKIYNANEPSAWEWHAHLLPDKDREEDRHTHRRGVKGQPARPMLQASSPLTPSKKARQSEQARHHRPKHMFKRMCMHLGL